MKSCTNNDLVKHVPAFLEAIDTVVEYILIAKGMYNQVETEDGTHLTDEAQHSYNEYTDRVEGMLLEIMELDI